MKVIAYLRVSTKRQGDSGLGLEAQQDYIDTACRANGWTVAQTFIEAGVSGTVPLEDRPAGKKAIEACKALGAVLLVAKLDRISRDVEHIARLMKTVPFKVCTMPHADSFQLHLFAALAEQERAFIAQRTKDALKQLQDRADSGDAQAMQSVANRNEKLARGRTAENRAKATQALVEKSEGFADEVKPHIQACLYSGCQTLQSIADCLNGRSVKTARGGEWKPMQVKRVMDKLSLSFS